MERETLRENLTARETWVRGLYMLLFAVLYSLAELVLVAVVIFQFVSRLATGGVNKRLLDFGQQLSRYLYDMLRFFTFNSEFKPYPFNPWPPTEPADEPPDAPAASVKKRSVARKKATTRKKAATKKRSTASPQVASSDADTPADKE
jgi:hypothetical protein